MQFLGPKAALLTHSSPRGALIRPSPTSWSFTPATIRTFPASTSGTIAVGFPDYAFGFVEANSTNEQNSAPMEATPGFVCAQCGTVHEGLPTDRGFELPDHVWAIPEPERAARAHWSTDLCAMDGRYFVRGVFSIPLIDRNDEFRWGVWTEVDRSVFVRYLEIFEIDASGEPLASGVLANVIPEHPDAKNERLLIEFGKSDQRPTFFAEADSLSRDAGCRRSHLV